MVHTAYLTRGKHIYIYVCIGVENNMLWLLEDRFGGTFVWQSALAPSTKRPLVSHVSDHKRNLGRLAAELAARALCMDRYSAAWHALECMACMGSICW